MKLIKILALACILPSCKKDYTCYCSSKLADIKGFAIHDTKKNAKKRCKNYETNGQLGYQTDGCEIKK